MKRYRVLCLVVAGIALTAPAAAAAPDLDALYRQQCNDIVSADWNAFDATLSPDYRGYNIEGDPDTRATEAASIQGMASSLKLDSCTTSIEAQEAGDRNANAILRFRLEGTLTKDTKRYRQGDRIAFVFHSADTWKYSDGKWLQVSADTLGSQVYVNGEMIRHTGLV